MATLKLFFLGSPRLELEGHLVEPDTRKATALLAYLTLAGGRRPTRDWLAAFLWPDFDDSRARAALRRTLSALKATVGGEGLVVTREVIGIDPGDIWCDVIEFERALAAAAAHDHEGEPLCPACLAHLETAVDLFRGEFMSGFSLRDSIPFDDWQLQESERLRQDFGAVLERLVNGAIAARQFETGLAYANRWLQLDPLREEAHRQLMRLLAWSGQRSAALLHYRRCVRLLDEELGVAPLPETTVLYQAIQNDAVPEPARPAVRPAPPTPTAGLPFVGRQAEQQRMAEVYRQVERGGRLLIIDGEPGIGKTRLAEALIAGTAGAVTLQARCYEGEANFAYAPFIQVLQRGAAETPPGRLHTLAEHQLAEAARLLPDLAAGRTLPDLPPLDSPGAQVRFFEGLAHLLQLLLSGTNPGILWFDDAHWLDAATQEFLLYLLHRWRDWPLLVILCWRGEEMPGDHLLRRLANDLRRDGASEIMTLDRFSPAEVDELMAATGRPFAADFGRQLYAETEGLPVFVVEYLNQLDLPGEVGDALPTPLSVRELLQNRLSRILETERQILQAAAVIGRGFEAALVQAASGRSVDETVDALERLARRGLTIEREMVYDFSHDKMRQLVYEEMGLARRRLLHRRLAETLAGRRPVASAAAAAQIAAHYQGAGLDDEAAGWFERAGDQARQLFAHQEALHYYRSALALGAAGGWRLQAACGDLSMRLGRYPEALAAFETAAALAPLEELGQIERRLAQLYQRQGAWSLAAATLDQAQAHLGQAAAPADRALLLLDRSLVAHRQNRSELALDLARQALTLAESASNRAALALAENILGLLARGRGEMDEAVMRLERSRRLARESDRLDIEIAARNNLALTLIGRGAPAEAEAHLQQALALCQRLGDRHHEAALRSNLGDVLHRLGRQAEAQEQVRQSAVLLAEIGRELDSWRPEIWRLTDW